ncbi:hypothetical protein LCGC14_1016250 [marine sediment metagenome]|uniref:Uncharacterized protein n=1 Tax=marine sediment metagenome TaxID=412755 RepID=A0A0F9R4T0_9ZZZZ
MSRWGAFGAYMAWLVSLETIRYLFTGHVNIEAAYYATNGAWFALATHWILS